MTKERVSLLAFYEKLADIQADLQAEIAVEAQDAAREDRLPEPKEDTVAALAGTYALQRYLKKDIVLLTVAGIIPRAQAIQIEEIRELVLRYEARAEREGEREGTKPDPFGSHFKGP